MKEKLLAIANKAKDIAISLAKKAPFPVGIALGYIFHAEIAIAIDIIKSLI